MGRVFNIQAALSKVWGNPRKIAVCFHDFVVVEDAPPGLLVDFEGNGFDWCYPVLEAEDTFDLIAEAVRKWMGTRGHKRVEVRRVEKLEAIGQGVCYAVNLTASWSEG